MIYDTDKLLTGFIKHHQPCQRNTETALYTSPFINVDNISPEKKINNNVCLKSLAGQKISVSVCSKEMQNFRSQNIKETEVNTDCRCCP